MTAAAEGARGVRLRRFLRRVAIGALVLLVLLVVAFRLTVAYVDRASAGRTTWPAYDGARKVWSTRGLVEAERGDRASDGNRVETIRRAFEHGAMGCEVDLFFDPELDRFVVSHRRDPYNRKDGELLFLERVLPLLGTDRHLWMDFKKLRLLDDAALAAAVARLELLVDRAGIERTRVWVEGGDPFHLGAFRDAGFSTILDVHQAPEGSPFGGWVLDFYELVHHFGGFTVMGMKTGELDAVVCGPATRRRLANVPLFLYHAPDDEPFLDELLADPGVRVVLLRDHTVDRFAREVVERP